MKTIVTIASAVLSLRLEGTKTIAVGLTIVLFLGFLCVPQPAYGQFGGLSSAFGFVNQAVSALQNFISNVMRPLLDSIQTAAQAVQRLLGQLRQLWETIVWPLDAINQAKALALQLIGLFRGLLDGLYGIGVNSAQLPNPAALEGLMRNKQYGDHGALVAVYGSVFGTLPPASDAHPQERALMDADDAMAIDQLMTLKMADAGADRVLEAARAVENEATRFAPGTAAMSTAAAYAAAIQSQAHIQKMIAGQLRQEAARLAHDNMAIKRGANFTRESKNKMTDLNR
jgi:hypothetical protein